MLVQVCRAKGVRGHTIIVAIIPPPPPPPHFTAYGYNVPTAVEQPLQKHTLHGGDKTGTYEARLLKALFLKLL